MTQKRRRKRRDRRVKNKRPSNIDRHGFRRLTDRDDLQALFLGPDDAPANPEPERFEDLLGKTRAPAEAAAEKGGPRKGTAASRASIAAQLRRYPAPEAELDLHGLTGPEAARHTEHFIRNAGLRGLRTVRIITGKGIHSENGPVLPDVTEQQTVALKAEGIVLTFRWERGAKRKSGALLVYLV